MSLGLCLLALRRHAAVLVLGKQRSLFSVKEVTNKGKQGSKEEETGKEEERTVREKKEEREEGRERENTKRRGAILAGGDGQNRLLAEAQRCVGEFAPQDLANVAWVPWI